MTSPRTLQHKHSVVAYKLDREYFKKKQNQKASKKKQKQTKESKRKKKQ